MHVIEVLTWFAIFFLSAVTAYFGDYDAAAGVVITGLICKGIVMVDEWIKEGK